VLSVLEGVGRRQRPGARAVGGRRARLDAVEDDRDGGAGLGGAGDRRLRVGDQVAVLRGGDGRGVGIRGVDRDGDRFRWGAFVPGRVGRRRGDLVLALTEGIGGVYDQMPSSSAVVVPTSSPSTAIVIVEPGSASPVIVGVVSFVVEPSAGAVTTADSG